MLALRQFRRRAADIARRSAFQAAGGLLLSVALGFLTAAAWHGLRGALGPVWAALILGGVYLVLGLLCLLVSRQAAPPPLPPPAADSPMERVVQAFIDGMAAGARARRPPR